MKIKGFFFHDCQKIMIYGFIYFQCLVLSVQCVPMSMDQGQANKVPKVTCPDGLDHCITLKGKMTVLESTQDFEQKNCSDNASCDSASDYNGKNVTAKNFNPPPTPSPPPPLRGRLPYKLHVGDAGRVFMV